MGVFLIGIIGCVIVIPVVALKFGSVLFEPHRDEKDQDASED